LLYPCGLTARRYGSMNAHIEAVRAGLGRSEHGIIIRVGGESFQRYQIPIRPSQIQNRPSGRLRCAVSRIDLACS